MRKLNILIFQCRIVVKNFCGRMFEDSYYYGSTNEHFMNFVALLKLVSGTLDVSVLVRTSRWK